MVIGEGSVPYDAFQTRAQLPLVVLPEWVDTPSQPIAVDDVIAYLREAAEVELDGSTIFEIGGADVVPYRAIVEALGGAAVTVHAPAAAASVATRLKAVQPARMRVVSDLLDSLRVDTSVHDDSALRRFSGTALRPRGLSEAIAGA